MLATGGLAFDLHVNVVGQEGEPPFRPVMERARHDRRQPLGFELVHEADAAGEPDESVETPEGHGIINLEDSGKLGVGRGAIRSDEAANQRRAIHGFRHGHRDKVARYGFLNVIEDHRGVGRAAAAVRHLNVDFDDKIGAVFVVDDIDSKLTDVGGQVGPDLRLADA